jgi:hypothetical protein
MPKPLLSEQIYVACSRLAPVIGPLLEQLAAAAAACTGIHNELEQQRLDPQAERAQLPPSAT